MCNYGSDDKMETSWIHFKTISFCIPSLKKEFGSCARFETLYQTDKQREKLQCIEKRIVDDTCCLKIARLNWFFNLFAMWPVLLYMIFTWA